MIYLVEQSHPQALQLPTAQFPLPIFFGSQSLFDLHGIQSPRPSVHASQHHLYQGLLLSFLHALQQYPLLLHPPSSCDTHHRFSRMPRSLRVVMSWGCSRHLRSWDRSTSAGRSSRSQFMTPRAPHSASRAARLDAGESDGGAARVDAAWLAMRPRKVMLSFMLKVKL